MAIRNIRYDGDDILRKVCRPVEKMDDRTLTLIDDMFDTMYEANGVGLAAPQVGILKRIVVIDVGDDKFLVFYKAVHPLPYHAKPFLDSFFKSTADGHHLTYRLHGRTQLFIDAMKFT